jgi:hypothetical protein
VEDVKDNGQIKELKRGIEQLEHRIKRLERRNPHNGPARKPSVQEGAVLRLLNTLAIDGRPVRNEQWQEQAIRRCFVSNAHVFRTVRSRLAQKGLIWRDGKMTWPAPASQEWKR